MTMLKSWRVRLALVLAVVGPGFITANVDNDAGGIATYSVAGAQFGYTLLWTMIPITIALVIIQEMSSRMGAVTGKGLSDLIREEFGLRATFVLMLALFVTNFFNIIGEFAGVASSFELFGVSKYIVVPLAAFVVWGIVVHGTYSTVEKVFLSASAFYVAYIVSGVLAHPDWRAAALSTVTRPESAGFRNYGYLSMIIGLAGTTIAPWMQFYLQASIVEKGVTARQYTTSRLDVVLIVFGAGVILIPRFPLFRVMVLSQVANGVLLPFVLIFVLLLVNDRELMGSYVNSKWYNVVSWVTVGVMIALTLAMVIAQAKG